MEICSKLTEICDDQETLEVSCNTQADQCPNKDYACRLVSKAVIDPMNMSANRKYKF